MPKPLEGNPPASVTVDPTRNGRIVVRGRYDCSTFSAPLRGSRNRLWTLQLDHIKKKTR